MENDFDSFISKVQGYHKAFKEEYEVISSENPDDIRKLIDQKMAAALPGFVDQLILIAQMGDTDNAKLSAIKFAFNWYFKESVGGEDPFTKMLNELTKNDVKTEEKST
jgi:hypothetical protein